jgi:hypothetical protein
MTQVEFLRLADQPTDADLAALLFDEWIGNDHAAAEIVVTARSDLHDFPQVEALGEVVTLAVGRHSVRGRGDPLVLLWPNKAVLDDTARIIASKSRVLVVMYQEGAAWTGWLRRYNAADLVGGVILAPLEGVLGDPVVEHGLRYLIQPYVRGNGYRSYPGKDKAVSTFRAFKREGVNLDRAVLFEFLVSNGASIEDAEILIDYAEKVDQNRIIRTRKGGGFTDNIMDVWRNDLAKKTAE